ncbi:craniofacial development protein 2-like [Artemia franciscana]|uniref:craniofacial development protein 2-like n=1 Tax=Artemia franciscana TaxID=6661 RepID=UPI0032D9F2B2
MDRRGLRIATWIVLTLNEPASKNLLSEELRKNKVSIAGLTETRLTGSGEERIGNSDSLLWSGGSSRRNGVGLALNDLTRKALLLHEAVSDRLMNARFGHKHGKMTVITCYAPTNDSDDATKEDFYSALSRCLAIVPPHDITVLLGDFNATVRDDMGLWRGTVGPVSPDPLNDNGLRLLELCRSHDLYITNTYFQRKTIPQYTWYSNDGRTKKMIDYVIISKRWRSLVKNCRTYRSAELGNADHRLVCADLRLRLHAQRSKRKPVAADIGKLKEPDTRQKYSIEISNSFEALGSLNSSEDLWKYFKLQTSDAAQLVLGKRSYPKKSWLTNETLQVIEQRRKARLLGDMTTYRRLNGVRNRLIHRDRTQFVARKANEIELAAKKKDMDSLFKHLRDLTENKTPTLGPVLSRDDFSLTKVLVLSGGRTTHILTFS